MVTNFRESRVNGNVWRADGGWIISDSKSSIRTVKISISEIFQEKRLDFSFDCSQIQFHFLGKQDFPCNSKTITKKTINNEERISSTNFNVAQLESEIGTFEFEKNDYGFSLNWVLGKKIVNKYKINRVESCLEFVFSKTFNLVKTTELFENVEITKLYPIKKKHETSLSFPPLMSLNYDPDGYVWSIFVKYLTKILQFDSPKRDPISQIAYSFISTLDLTIETQCLGLSIGIEKLVSFEEFNDFRSSNSFDLEDIEAKLVSGGIDDSLRKRMLGVIASWKRPNAAQILKRIQEKGIISEEEFEAWKRIRNASAHGDIGNIGNPRRVLVFKDQILNLFHKLIFFLIGYSGGYTNYADPNKKIDDFFCPK